MSGLERQALSIRTRAQSCSWGFAGQARASSGGEWYESGTELYEVCCKERNARPVGLVVPIHHRGDGEAARRLGAGRA